MTVPEKAGSKGLPALEFPLKKVKVLECLGPEDLYFQSD
jgi:hypothetical protein